MFDALKHGPKITFAVERRAIVGKPARICWEPVGLIQAHTLEGAIEKAAFMCGSPSVLRATEMTVSPVPKRSSTR